MRIISEESLLSCKKQQESETLQNSSSPCNKSHHLCCTGNGLCNAVIPVTAVPVKITNIQNLYIMRAYEIKEYFDKLDRINRKLVSYVKTKLTDVLKESINVQDPKIGDTVIVESSKQKYVMELPSFVCRGRITYIENAVYNVLFVDYGVSFKLSRDQFCIVPCNFISNEHLTKIVGVYNILPVCTRKNTLNGSKSRPTVVLETKWSDKAIRYTKDLLIASQAVYFDHLLTDERNGREYGEFYLVIDDTIVALSEALIIDYHAVYIKGELLQLIKRFKHIQHEDTREEFIINVKFSIDRINRYCTTLNGSDNSLKKLCLSEKILIHSRENCNVFSNVTDLGFPSEIHEAWEECIRSSRPRKLQSYIWPAIKKGLNVVAIGASQCGKTSACVMAICGLVAIRQKELSRNATRPLALILCSSSCEVISVQSMCASFLRTTGNTRSVAAFNGKTNRSIAAEIYSGCQILISTPRYLVRFLNENPELLSFDRLFYLVFDNADIILDKYYHSVGELFKKHNVIENREPRGDDRPLLQIIIFATYWTSQIKKFARFVMYNPYMCIASFSEAVVFKSVHPKIYVLKAAAKNKEISDILKDDYKRLKTMVVCINAEEAEELNAFLFSTMKKTLLIHEKMKPSDMQNLREKWKASVYDLYPILICTDAVLSELDFTDIQWLIHHSVQLQFKNQFNYRFSVLLDDLVQNTTNCKVSIMIDENNNVQFQSILKMMMRMKVVISPELQECVERIAITLERDKKDYAICDNVKAYGFCQARDVCMFRHCMLPTIDEPMMKIETNDKVKLMLMYVHDASHFSARVIEHIPHSDDSKKITFSNKEYIETAAKIQQYYQNIENRKMCASTEVGDICILEESLDAFKRVQIRSIRYHRSDSEVKYVDVRCIDSGVIYEYIDIRRLIHIPEELSKLPTHIVEVFLANIAPYDEEYIWNRYSNDAVHKWCAEHFNNMSYIIGKVHLHLGNTIWLNDLKIGTKLLAYTDLIGFSLKEHLLSGNYAISNNDHMSQLSKLCKDCGLTEVNPL